MLDPQRSLAQRAANSIGFALKQIRPARIVVYNENSAGQRLDFSDRVTAGLFFGKRLAAIRPLRFVRHCGMLPFYERWSTGSEF